MKVDHGHESQIKSEVQSEYACNCELQSESELEFTTRHKLIHIRHLSTKRHNVQQVMTGVTVRLAREQTA